MSKSKKHKRAELLSLNATEPKQSDCDAEIIQEHESDVEVDSKNSEDGDEGPVSEEEFEAR